MVIYPVALHYMVARVHNELLMVANVLCRCCVASTFEFTDIHVWTLQFNTHHTVEALAESIT